MAKIIFQTSVSIGSLPNSCLQKSRLLEWSYPYATVNLVLVVDGNGYSGYIGYPDRRELNPQYQADTTAIYHCEKIRTHKQVAQLGDKLDQDTRDFFFRDKIGSK